MTRRSGRPFRWLAPGAVVLSAIFSVATADAGPGFSGILRVVDGDTIEVGNRRVVLHGIDAPELSQTCRRDGRTWPCGRAAVRALENFVGDRIVHCRPIAAGSAGETLARCGVGGLDLGAELVGRGLAVAALKETRYYFRNQAEARYVGAGMWGGGFMAPWEWRRGRRLAQAETDGDCSCTARHRAFLGRKRETKPAATAPACRIKGDISAAGDRLYHLPGDAAYDRAKINPMKGERWFCSEDEARAAGWYKTKP